MTEQCALWRTPIGCPHDMSHAEVHLGRPGSRGCRVTWKAAMAEGQPGSMCWRGSTFHVLSTEFCKARA